jgi:very-short-patch-repair endonuclease
MTDRQADATLRSFATHNHGALSAEEARRLGVPPKRLRAAVNRGEFEIAGDGVYRVAASAWTWHHRLRIALLVAGDGAAVSHRAAASLLAIPGFPARRIEIVAPHGRKNHRLPGVAFHESRYLPGTHVRRVDGLPVTSLDRTLFDLAGVLAHAEQTERAIDNSLSAGRTSPERLWRTWAELAAPGRPGSRVMRTILIKRVPGFVATASELERMFEKLLESAGLAPMEKQVNAGGEDWIGRVDFLDRAPRAIFELDGRVGHASELDRARDRHRDAELLAAGFRPFRITYEDLVLRAAWVLGIVRKTRGLAA